MHLILKNILAVLVGIIIGGAVNMGIIMISGTHVVQCVGPSRSVYSDGINGWKISDKQEPTRKFELALVKI